MRETASTALIEGNNSLGAVVGNFAMGVAIEKAKSTGVGWVTVRGSNHFGIAGHYSAQALSQNMLGMAFTNGRAIKVDQLLASSNLYWQSYQQSQPQVPRKWSAISTHLSNLIDLLTPSIRDKVL